MEESVENIRDILMTKLQWELEPHPKYFFDETEHYWRKKLHDWDAPASSGYLKKLIEDTKNAVHGRKEPNR